MATGYEIEMYNNIGVIARSAARIADALEKIANQDDADGTQPSSTAPEGME
jgi:hypothetical protein